MKLATPLAGSSVPQVEVIASAFLLHVVQNLVLALIALLALRELAIHAVVGRTEGLHVAPALLAVEELARVSGQVALNVGERIVDDRQRQLGPHRLAVAVAHGDAQLALATGDVGLRIVRDLDIEERLRGRNDELLRIEEALAVEQTDRA